MSRASLAAWAGVAVLLWACAPPPVKPPPSKAEVCTNGVDDNGDGKTDCADPTCFKNPSCAMSSEDCSNGVDDNGDGNADCKDASCAGAPGCGSGPEVCKGGVDEDGDGLTDCADVDCAADPACKTAESCLNGVDDDGDGKVDCADSDCAGAANCQGGEAGKCANGADDDGDGLTDCADPDCTGGACGAGCTCGGGQKRETLCSDSADNDGDGQSDCADADCSQAPNCAQSGEAGKCNDGLDNDNDGLTDCQDTLDCNGAPCGAGCACGSGSKRETDCGDGVDNDADSRTDCADADCVGSGTESCSDGVDNNCDRAIDCADGKCAGNAACSGLSDGLPCASDGQCAGGKCLLEATTGVPNGACSNAASCSVTGQTGCNGGICVESGTFDLCRMRCTGNGLGTSGRCRAGFACFDTDTNTGNSNNYCIPLCAADSECQGGGSGYGCNSWSKLCQQKDKGLLKYGQACTASGQCESGRCAPSSYYPGGYCYGYCTGSAKSCGGDGVCYFDPSYGDNVGVCYDGCSSTAQCRGTPYTCQDRGGGYVCTCRFADVSCALDSQCCSGICDSFWFICW
ncbi:MAG: hypothetical protein HYZ28_24125 [Myxococcales bacterium]|nr:hypothetical protein [Myxococcales bacterium]